jgi:hypothetical protein
LLTKTTNLNLTKPDLTDNADITVINTNMDLLDSAVALKANTSQLPTKVSQLTNDSNFISSTGAPVQSVNSKIGVVSLTASDIGAEPTISTKNSAFNQSFETNAANIKMDGTASTGTSNNVAKADHVHQSDTSKANITDLAMTNTNVTGVTNLVNSHLTDYVRQPGYAVDTGTANHLIVTLNPVPTSYIDGMGVVVKVKVAGTAATDINVNNLGIKNIFDSLGNAVTNFRANTTYSLKYESVSGNFILQGKGGVIPKLLNLIINGSFENGTDSWVSGGNVSTITIPSGTGKFGSYTHYQTTAIGWMTQNIPYVVGHKYYISGWAWFASASCYGAITVAVNNGSNIFINGDLSKLNQWQFGSTVITCAGVLQLSAGIWGDGRAENVNRDGFLAIDLTDAFGAGYEPSQAEMDYLVSRMGGWWDSVLPANGFAGNGSDGALSLADVYSANPTPTVNGTLNSGSAANLVDGNVATNVNINVTANNPILTLNYGVAVTLDTFIIYACSANNGGNFYLQYSNDGTNYTTAYTFTLPVSITRDLLANFTATSAGYWRLLMGSSGVSNFILTDIAGYKTTVFASTLNGPPVTKQFTSISIGKGNRITVSNPCRGLFLYSPGSVVINGLIDMSKMGGVSDGYFYPIIYNMLLGAGSSKGLIPKIDLSILNGGTGGNGGAAGTLSAWTAALGAPSVGSTRLLCGGTGGGGAGGWAVGGAFISGCGGIVLSELASPYGAGGNASTNTPNSSWSAGPTNNGCNGGGGAGSSTGYGASTYTTSGKGGNAYGGGGGGGGGCGSSSGNLSSSAGIDGEYAGGYICITCNGTITLGAMGKIIANGGNGGAGGAGTYQGTSGCTGGGGGGGAGGGVVHLFYRMSLSNSGQIVVSGGYGGLAGPPGGGYSGTGYIGANGTAGGIGSIISQQIL